MKKLMLFVIFISTYVHAQDDEQLFNQLFDEIFISSDNVENLEEIYQQLFYYYQHPLNLNKVNTDNLRSLNILTDQQVSDILMHREKNGSFLSVYELQAIPSLSVSDLKILSSFVTVNESGLPGEGNDFLIIRYDRDLQVRKGYRDLPETPGVTPYLGTPDKILFRLKSSVGNKISFGLLAEKDAGENIIWDRSSGRYGMDHHSGYALYKNEGMLEKLVIGDYHLQFGQGLVYSSGFALGKSAGDIAGFRRISVGIRPHTSTLESGFLRGVAATFKLNNFRVTGFLSSNNSDASIDSKSNTFSGINQSGFHRTRGEVANKDNLNVKEAGVLIKYDKKGFSAGFGASSIRFSNIWKPVDRMYNINAYTGRELNSVFGYISYGWRNINLYNETAYLHQGGLATVGGALLNLTASLQSGFIYRNYSSGFASIHGNAIGEKTSNTNEKGILWVTNYTYNKKIQFSFYFDRFTFPWLSFQISQPSQGYEYLFRMRYNLSRSSYFLIQYKEEEKGQDVKNTYANQVWMDTKRNYQLIVHYPVTENLSLRTRIQGSNTSLNGGHGMAMLQDLTFTELKYKLTLRYAVFNVRDFDNRQYVYENDVLYSFSFPALQGRGSRFYLLFKYNLSKKFKIWGRYSQTLYSDRQEISSGNELIDGNRLTEVKMQVMYNF